MEEEKIRKDANGNIINKSNKKNYHITMIENLVTRIEVESYKQYNVLDDDNDDEDENNKEDLMKNYTPKRVDNFANNDPHGGSMVKCIIT